VIVGGWVYRESLASITLARAGLKVVVLEGGRLGGGASLFEMVVTWPSFSKLGVGRRGAPITVVTVFRLTKEIWWRLLVVWTSSKKTDRFVSLVLSRDFVRPVILAFTLT